MASYSVTTPPIVTSQEIGGKSDLVNHSANNWLGMITLINLFRCLHSWIWSEICMELVWQREVKSLVPISYRMGSWKCGRKDMERELKSWKEPRGSSIFYLTVEPVSVRWKRRKRIELSIKEFDEHHKWKVITWLFGSSPGLPSNFKISEGSLVEITGQKG